MIVPMCGKRECVKGTVRSTLKRRIPMRILIVSSYSTSNARLTMVGCVSDKGVHCVRGRRGVKTTHSEGQNMGRTQKGCVTFLSTSS